MPTPTPISYGSEITTDSVATLESLGGTPTTKLQPLAVLIVSRDGSRRVLNVGQNMTFINTTLLPGISRSKPLFSRPTNGIQRWEGLPARRHWRFRK